MKRSQKVMSVILTGTLAFSSVSIAPMMAFADEITQTQGTYLQIKDGLPEAIVDANGDPVLGAESVYVGPYSAYNYGNYNYRNNYRNYNYRGRATNGYVAYDGWGNYIAGDNRGNVVVGTDYGYGYAGCVFMSPVSGYTGAIDYCGNFAYPRYASGYTYYNGRVSVDLYRGFALEAAREVRSQLLARTDKSSEDERRLNDAISRIEGASSTSTIDSAMSDVRAIASKYGIYVNTTWYLPYDYDYRCDYRGYNWRYDWRPCDHRDYYYEEVKTVSVYRLVNPDNNDHVFTTSSTKRSDLIKEGWTPEDVAWSARETSNTPVYELTSKSGRHFYTTSTKERDELKDGGWNYEGVAFYGSASDKTSVYRLYNKQTNAHFFTKNNKEKNDLVKAGWEYEGVAFYVG